MTTPQRHLAALAAWAIILPSAAFAQTSVDGQSDSFGWIITGIVAVVMLGAGYAMRAAQATTETWAAPRRTKPEADQTLTDKAIIELDKKVDLINIDILERFTRSFVSARLPTILSRVPHIGPIIIAADLAQDAMKEWQQRNPGTQRDMKVTPEAMKGKLAGAIGEASKDALTEALVKAGVPKEWTSAATDLGTAIGQGRLDLP